MHDLILIQLNLKARTDRLWSCIGSHSARSVPMDKVFFFDAIPVEHFESVEAIVTAMVEDGFPETTKLYENWQVDRDNPWLLAQSWSYLQVLRFIANQEAHVIFLYDDRMLAHDWKFYSDFFRHLSASYIPKCSVLQLEYYALHNVNPSLTRYLHPTIPYVARGPLGGSDNAIYYTPEGARLMLHLLLEHFKGNIELTLGYFTYFPEHAKDGLWTCLTPLTQINYVFERWAPNPPAFHRISTDGHVYSEDTFLGSRHE